MAIDLKGKIALVTGAGVGIGREAAIQLAAYGAKVAFHVFQSKESGEHAVNEVRSKGGEAALFQADLTKLDEIERLVQEVTSTFGGSIDILFNNSGGLVKRTKNLEVSEEYYTKVMDINLKSTIFTSKAVLPGMIEKKSGKIINMASLAAHNGGSQGSTIYAASKAAVITYTKGLAKEVAEHNIHVNAVAPGFIGETPFHDTHTSAEARAATVASIPLAREGLPFDVAGAVLYLASNLSDFLTGETIDINGGVLMR